MGIGGHRMSEIEKMYENAGIKPYKFYGVYYHHIEYPPFTAEKQIDLIKWLIQKYKNILIEHKLNLFYINIRDIYTGMVHIEFDETIAGLINNLWKDLTEQERTEIKKILK